MRAPTRRCSALGRQHASKWPKWRTARQSLRSRTPYWEKSTERPPIRRQRACRCRRPTTDRLFGHNNHFVVGASFDSSVTRFTASAELGTIGPNFVVSGSGIFLGQSGDPVSIGPVALRTTNQYSGLYALDTFDVTNAFSITGGGRFNVANISTGGPDRQRAQRQRLPTPASIRSLAAPTRSRPNLTAYAGYSEANRAPTPLELGCADPAHPCIIAAFLVSDPPLETGCVPHRGSRPARYQGPEHRHARMEARRVSRG